MHIETFLPAEYDAALAADVSAVRHAAGAVDCPHEHQLDARATLLELRHGWDGYGPDVVFRLTEGLEVLGVASVETSHWGDNADLAWIELVVVPDARGRGHGAALLQAAQEWAHAAHKPLLMGGTWVGSPGENFPDRFGYRPGMVEEERRLDLDTLDHDRIVKLHDEAAERTADYELVRLAGPVPDHLLPDLVAVAAVINDAPLDDLEFEDEVFSEDRLRTFDQSRAARQQRVYRILARRVSDGAWAGQTFVTVDANQDGVVEQGDTSVARAHRGHRLGLLLKTEMLGWLRDVEPGLRTWDTWNAASNAHMIAVNDALGCRVVGRTVAWQRRM
ncbi:MAG TPA: GNAT family N-acetyltransferase [Nocardioidaceae bacterium]|nr:GNAT family N-acetyltransferase [Nocardioidaceae bacterium]